MESAHAEGGVEPEKMVRLLLLDPDHLATALDGLVQAGLMKSDGGRFLLTPDGEAKVNAWYASESAGVKRAARTWQPR